MKSLKLEVPEKEMIELIAGRFAIDIEEMKGTFVYKNKKFIFEYKTKGDKSK